MKGGASGEAGRLSAASTHSSVEESLTTLAGWLAVGLSRNLHRAGAKITALLVQVTPKRFSAFPHLDAACATLPLFGLALPMQSARHGVQLLKYTANQRGAVICTRRKQHSWRYYACAGAHVDPSEDINSLNTELELQE